MSFAWAVPCHVILTISESRATSFFSLTLIYIKQDVLLITHFCFNKFPVHLLLSFFLFFPFLFCCQYAGVRVPTMWH